MFRLFLSFIFSFIIVSIASAKTIIFMAGSSPTGGNTALSKLVAETITNNKLSVDFKATGNCSLVKSGWNSEQGPMLITWESPFNSEESPCRIDFIDGEILVLLYEFPQAMCNFSNKSMEDYLKPNNQYLVGVPGRNIQYEKLFNDIEKTSGIKHTIIPYKNVNDLQTSLKTQEIDWVLMGKDAAEKLGAKCIWDTGRDTTVGLKRALDIWPSISSSVAYYTVWIAGKNLSTQEIKVIKESLEQASQTIEWKNLENSRGYKGFNLDKQTINSKILHKINKN
jgi:hypothetical protein